MKSDRSLSSARSTTLDLPPVVKPTMSKYRFEVLFWGVRDLKRIALMTVKRPRVDFVVGGDAPISAGALADIKLNSNFENNVQFLDVVRFILLHIDIKSHIVVNTGNVNVSF